MSTKNLDMYRQVQNLIIENLQYSELKRLFSGDSVLNTRIDEVKRLAMNRTFVLESEVLGVRELTDSFSINNKIDFDLNDGSTVCIDKDTYSFLSKLKIDEEILEYMQESKNNFIEIITQIMD